MKRILIPVLFCLAFTGKSFSQIKSDKLFLKDGPKEVVIKEVGTGIIKYTYSGEEVLYSISKNLVDKIEFSSGRTEEFKSPFQEVNTLLDINKIFVTFNPVEIEGLEIMGNLFSKAVGVTTLSSVNNVNNRALTKLKTEAFMMGANALFIGNQFQRGNQYGNENTPGNSTMTTYSAKAYSSEKLDIEAARALIENHKFYYHQKIQLARNGWSPSISIQESVDKELNPILFNLGEVIEKEGKLFVEPQDLKYKGESLEVIRIGDDMITLMDRTYKAVVNFDLLSDQNMLVQNQIKMVQLRKERDNKNSL